MTDAEPTGFDSFVPPPGFRSGYAAICGYPNVGKSTLLNTILRQRLAIVTPKPQTTRRRTLGILTTTSYQMIFIDTPGILDPRYDLQETMMRQVEQSIRDADLLLYIADVRRPVVAPGVAAVGRKKPVIAVLNKADLLRRAEDGLPAIERLKNAGEFIDFFVISAKKGRGVAQVLERAATLLPVGRPLYPPDQVTEHPERFFVGELIREAVFEMFREEVPYSAEVELTSFRENPAGKDLIEAIIFVETESQKGILIGKGGEAIKGLGAQARRAIEEFLERPVYLALRVRVLPHWRRDRRALRRFGY
jgi:GTP-binding protein Era